MGKGKKTTRVGYLLKMYPRFTQTFVVNEILELERQGAHVEIVSLRLPNEGVFHDSVSRVKGRASYLPESHHGCLGAIAKRQCKLWSKNPSQYRRAVRLWRQHQDVDWYHLVQAAYVLRWVRRNKISHLHVHFGTEEATVALLANILGGISYSLTLHAFDIYRDNVDRGLLREKINASTFAVTVCNANRRFMMENIPGVDAEKIRVNYNGIDSERFSPTEDERVDMSIFSVGRLIEKKGFSYLINAVAALRAEGLPVTCEIAGDGRDQVKLQTQIEDLGLAAHVKLIGQCRQEEVRRKFRTASCCVLPCVEAKDGNVDALPTVLLEAMASGCPSISTRISGVPEMIDDRKSGLLADPHDIKGLTYAIKEVLVNPSLAMRLAAGGRRRVEERFNIGANVGTMLGWFADAVGRAKRASKARRVVAPTIPSALETLNAEAS